MKPKTILYARVSTIDQTIAHQRTQAEGAGFTIDDVVSDHGVSGVNVPLRERKEGKRLFDILRAGDTLVVRWVDRLGRNYADVCETIRQLMKQGVVIRTVINNMTFDGATTDPMQMAVRDSLISFMAAMSQSQAEATKEAQKAGIAHAKEAGDRSYLGRKPTFSTAQFNLVINMLDAGTFGISDIAKAAVISRQTVYRIRDDKVNMAKALEQWQPKSKTAA